MEKLLPIVVGMKLNAIANAATIVPSIQTFSRMLLKKTPPLLFELVHTTKEEQTDNKIVYISLLHHNPYAHVNEIRFEGSESNDSISA